MENEKDEGIMWDLSGSHKRSDNNIYSHGWGGWQFCFVVVRTSVMITRRRSNTRRKLKNQILWLVVAQRPGVIRNLHGFGDDFDWFRKLRLPWSFLKSVKKMIKVFFSEENERHFWCLWQSLEDSGRQLRSMQWHLFLPAQLRSHLIRDSAHSERRRSFPAPKTTFCLDNQGQTM